MSTFRRRLMINKITPSGRLPDTYQEVEYIECTGDGAYINTDVRTTTYVTAHIDTMYVSTASGTKLLFFGGTGAGNWVGQYNRKYAAGSTAASISSVSASERKNLIVILDDRGSFLTVDNETVSREGTHTSSGYYNLFSGTTYTPNARVYECIIYQNSDNTKIRHFIPCYRKVDNEIGLYDLVSNDFFPNASTSGVFLKGSDV